MTRFSTEFGLTNTQAELDFVDIELTRDTPLYLDPYAIQLKSDEWSEACVERIKSFFQELLASLRSNDIGRATHLLSNLHEPNETRLGVSQGLPNGRAFGVIKARSLANAMRRSRAFTTGVLSDVSEAELFVRYIGSDTISDLVTNVCRDVLADYTSEQCNLHGILTQNVNTLGPIWNRQTLDWEAKPLNLPVFMSNPILLVPKFSVRRSLALDSQEFWNFHMSEFLQQEYLNAGSALVKTFKDGREYVTKCSVQKIHPKVKDDLADFVIKHPEVLEDYKSLKGAEGPLSNEDFALAVENEIFDEKILAEALSNKLALIPTGRNDASAFHKHAMAICTFLFYPKLTVPIKEQEIHQGRKRIDIKFTNSATQGFFYRMLESSSTRSINVPIECKNYLKEITNPELDQLAGRFSLHRGKFGILLCRSMDDKPRFIERCRDTVADGRGYIIVLDDNDLLHMLKQVQTGNRGFIDDFLQERYDEIS